MASVDRRVSDANTLVEGNNPSQIYVLDRRQDHENEGQELSYPISYLQQHDTLITKIKQDLGIDAGEEFVLTSTTREEVTADTLANVEDGDTLYVLQDKNQELTEQVRERVSFLPHYDTIVKGGMYEYYASEGQNPLPYAFAELIDNALAAVSDNKTSRKIEIRLHLDDNYIFVLDNGRGMSSRQLNNWAVYRLSKFIRKEKKALASEESEEEVERLPFNAPRSLNSDISYFGVGGKQAVFFIGSSTRMITRPKGHQDVHELTISKDQFEEKEKNREAIYSGFIRNRKAADVRHTSEAEELLREVILEEKDKECFTTVVITGINPNHIPYLKGNFNAWTTQLAHLYHYYLHGPNGNVANESERSRFFKNIDISVKLCVRGKEPQIMHLRDVINDMQTQCIRTAAAAFEFKATVEGTGIVEGVMRYHPFLYDKETFPHDPLEVKDETEEEQEESSDTRPARGRRPIFECYWNGRLIPYTCIEDFDWCAAPKKAKHVPLECFNRVSGVLWTNDKFQVSTNKLTFMDLEMRLKDKNTAYCRIIGRNEKRTDIGKEFASWLAECHEKSDKQIRFSHFIGSTLRTDLPKHRLGPWATYSQIEWDQKVYKKGQLVRITKTLPYIYGQIQKFLLFGPHTGEVYATGGEVQLLQEPRSLYDEVRTVPLSKMDRAISVSAVKKYIEDEEAKLPDCLIVSWPEGDEVKQSQKRQAGQAVGDIKVEIANRRGEVISKLPGSRQSKLLMELKVIWHGGNGEEVIVQHISQHGKTWPYWFRRMEGNIKHLGSYSLTLQTVLNESGANSFAGEQLPKHVIKFSVIEGAAKKFSIGSFEGPFKIGTPFTIPLEFQDACGNHAKPSSDLKPILEAPGLDITVKDCSVRGSQLLLKDVVAVGSVPTNAGKTFNVSIRIPDFEEKPRNVKVRLLPGPPFKLTVKPAEEFELENGSPAKFDVEISDEAGNPTMQPRLAVTCKFTGANGLPGYTVDCATSSRGVLTGAPICIKKMSGPVIISAKIEVTGVKTIAPQQVAITVMPSSRAACIEVHYKGTDGELVPIIAGEELEGPCGDSIRGIVYSVFDEAGRPIEINDSFASKVKVNWTPRVTKDSLKGKLPDVKIPNLMTECKYCHVGITDSSGISFEFSVRGLVGEPESLKCSISGSAEVLMGEQLDSDILVCVLDKHGNEIKKFEKGVLQDLCISGEGLIENEAVRMLGQQSGFNIQGVKFEKDVPLGSHELCVQWRGFKSYVRVEIVAGPPATLSIPEWDIKQPVTVYNESKLPQPLIVQLCDEFGNPSHTPKIKIQLAKDSGLKLMPAPQAIRSDDEGQADFGVFTVSGKRGVYEVQPKALIGRQTVSGPKIRVSIQSDPSRAHCLQVEYDKSSSYVVDGPLPDFTVKVMTEEESLLTTAKGASLSMRLSSAASSAKNQVIQMTPDKKSSPGLFHFTKGRLPKTSGTLLIQFSFKDGKQEIVSKQIVVIVQPGCAKELLPTDEPGMPTVSNTKSTSSRTLLRNLVLELKDAFGNTIDMDGQLRVTVEGGQKEVPQLEADDIPLLVPMNGGCAAFPSLLMEENTAGKDGQEYHLHCVLEDSPNVQSYDLAFLFYNDVKKQSQMAALSKERDALLAAIKTYRSLFETSSQLVKELRMSLQEADQEETRLRRELKLPASVNTVTSVNQLISTKSLQKDQAMAQRRRMCGLPPAPQDSLVLGKIAHLAQVKDDSIARVLSWHMSADMDCVVTLTTQKAQEIYKESVGKQQVLPLDSIYRKNLPDWNKPLPHQRLKPNSQPKGNPVYARNLLVFPRDTEHCQIVFGMLLGDTIILDTLEEANLYRQDIVKHTHCPTILTRQGDRVRSNGKFGGLMNRALPIEKLRGAVFSAPLPTSVQTLASEIDLLHNLKSGMQKTQVAMEELDEQLAAQDTPEMKAKHKELKEAEAQLADLEKRLGMSAQRGLSRSAEEEASPPPPVVKKSRGSNSNSVNGGTPTRASLRRSAGSTLPSPDFEYPSTRKRSKRS